jgi:hypothetical protein
VIGGQFVREVIVRGMKAGGQNLNSIPLTVIRALVKKTHAACR